MENDKRAAAAVNKRRILVVDDERDVANAFAGLLEALGYCVRCAHAGLTALAAIVEFRPDTVFLDIGLPDMDGYEVSRRMRRYDPRVRVIALSGDPSEEAERLALNFFDAFILKPGTVQHIERALALAV